MGMGGSENVINKQDEAGERARFALVCSKVPAPWPRALTSDLALACAFPGRPGCLHRALTLSFENQSITIISKGRQGACTLGEAAPGQPARTTTTTTWPALQVHPGAPPCWGTSLRSSAGTAGSGVAVWAGPPGSHVLHLYVLSGLQTQGKEAG